MIFILAIMDILSAKSDVNGLQEKSMFFFSQFQIGKGLKNKNIFKKLNVIFILKCSRVIVMKERKKLFRLNQI